MYEVENVKNIMKCYFDIMMESCWKCVNIGEI